MSYPRLSSSCRAFTMVELLVSIAIVGVLASLLLSALPKIYAEADRASCASGLRAVGSAIMAYAGENDQTLPGPLWGAQAYTYQTSDNSSGMLASALWAYLPVPPPASKSQVSKPLLCPAWRRQIKDKKLAGRCFRVNLQATLVSGKTGSPFGYPGSAEDSPTPPLRITMIKSLSDTFSLTDMDQVNQSAYAGNPLVPKTAIHGNSRNMLYLDGHVGTEPLPTHTP